MAVTSYIKMQCSVTAGVVARLRALHECSLILIGTLLLGYGEVWGIQPIPVETVKTCECEDLQDISNRLKEARAAVDSYKAEIEIIRQQEARTGQTVEFTGGRRKKLQGKVQVSLNKVTDQKARKGTGETGTGSCDITNNGQTPCLRKYIERHESVHQAACEEVNGFTRRYINLKHGYFAGYTLLQYAEEEIKAYSAEIPLIEADLERLKNECELVFEVDLVSKTPHGNGQMQLDTTKGIIYLSYDPYKEIHAGKGSIEIIKSLTGTGPCLIEMLPPTSHPIEVTVMITKGLGSTPSIQVGASASPDGGFIHRCHISEWPFFFERSFPLYDPQQTVTITDWDYGEEDGLVAVKKIPHNIGEFRIRKLKLPSP